MNDKKCCFQARCAGGVLGVVLLATLTGCIVDGRRSGYAAPVVVVQDDYVYYPNYEIYYSSSRHQYAYFERGAWVSRPAPHGVRVNVLLASPSVRMDFHDSPEHHHVEVVQKYPRNSVPSESNRSRKEKQKGEERDERDEHGENRAR